MEMQTLMQYFVDYGPVAIFTIVLLEYLNLPGFPAGVIMPLAGVWAAKGNLNFFFTIAITVAAGVTGSIILCGIWCLWEPVICSGMRYFPCLHNVKRGDQL